MSPANNCYVLCKTCLIIKKISDTLSPRCLSELPAGHRSWISIWKGSVGVSDTKDREATPHLSLLTLRLGLRTPSQSSRGGVTSSSADDTHNLPTGLVDSSHADPNRASPSVRGEPESHRDLPVGRAPAHLDALDLCSGSGNGSTRPTQDAERRGGQAAQRDPEPRPPPPPAGLRSALHPTQSYRILEEDRRRGRPQVQTRVEGPR